MSPRDGLRRQWTHRRLGLGNVQPTDSELASTESLLASVGARRPPIAGSADGFDATLFDFVCDIDLAAGVPAIDAVPIPLSALRATLPTPRSTRLTWRVLIPAAMSGVAAVAIAISAILAGSPTPDSPALTATAESRQLLTHADTLLTAASHAASSDRATLVSEAKADLSHVSRLLPLAAPSARSAIRDRMTALDRRAKPLSAGSPRPSASADTVSSGDGETTPVRERAGQRPPATHADGSDRTGTAAPTNEGGAASGESPTTQPAPRPQQTAGTLPPPSGGGMRGTPPQGTTQEQPPPPDGAPRPRP
ncbi:MAG TPA: hypothetical protein VHD81_04645 [Mycobacteriales bacterium]|nr:hypothetical protein [Mycobacteriales bacterium]